MERLTSREPRASGMPGVCCTHFEGRDCQAIQGRCADGCAWEEAAWDRLAAYEDTGLTPEEIIGLCSMDRRAKMAELLRMEENKPLTSDELLKMDGTPVWITKMDGSGGVWMLVDAEYKLCREAHGEMAVFENCGKTWTASRHKMEPDEIRCLLQTGAGGLYKKLPCKEGDPVWWINVAWLPGNGPMFYKIDSGKFRFAMLDWQNPIYTSQADAEAALAEMVSASKKEGTANDG